MVKKIRADQLRKLIANEAEVSLETVQEHETLDSLCQALYNTESELPCIVMLAAIEEAYGIQFSSELTQGDKGLDRLMNMRYSELAAYIADHH